VTARRWVGSLVKLRELTLMVVACASKAEKLKS
jgi:hypothetical protein